MTTTEEVIKLAREAGLLTGTVDSGKTSFPFVCPCVGTNCFPEITRLIDLVRAEENEACAKINDEPHFKIVVRNELKRRADAMRARRKS